LNEVISTKLDPVELYHVQAGIWGLSRGRTGRRGL